MRRFKVDLKDGAVTGIAYGDPVRPIEVMFLHATGFNALTYQSVLEPLGGQMHCAAIDLRGHGRTSLPAPPRKLKSWNRFRDDVIQVLQETSPQGVVLGGHSMGATVALLVAAKRPDLVRGLTLVDPVLLKRGTYFTQHIPLFGQLGAETALSRGARRRRNQFASNAEAAEYFYGRGAFKTWRPPFLDDYVVDGVLRRDDGSFGLACEPEWEASVFKAHRYRPWGAIRKLKKRRIPLIVLQANRDSTALPDTAERIHAVRPDAAVTRVPGTTHFVPMERPYVVRDALRLLFEATMEGAEDVDYVGAVRRTIDESVGLMA